MENIIKKHMERYPEMELRDIFKLIYQSEFGGGHMIEDKEKSLEWIKKEAEFVRSQNWPVRECVCEDIDGDMCRVYLDVLGDKRDERLGRFDKSNASICPETLNEMFVQSANAKRGTVEGLESKLEQFLDFCEAEECRFSREEVKQAIADWRGAGYPAVHHSAVYRDNYFPAYRVVMKKYAEKLEVFEKIDSYLKNHAESEQPVIVTIDGMSGAGKSVLGRLLQEIYHCNLFHMDDFFLQPYQRTKERFAEPGGNVDYERFRSEVLEHLNDPEGLWYQKYDCSTQSLKEKVFVPYNKLVIIEGTYSLHPYFEERADLAFFMEISDEVQIERIRNRNGEQMLKRFLEEWIPMERKYFEMIKMLPKDYMWILGGWS